MRMQVYLATLNSLTPVAVKKLAAMHEDSVREAALLKCLQSPHIVQFLVQPLLHNDTSLCFESSGSLILLAKRVGCP